MPKREPTQAQLGKMSNEDLISKGYVRIPGFTRKDGTKVKSHIRKLDPKGPGVGSAAIDKVVQKGGQTPDQIIQAEKDAGNIGRKVRNTRLDKITKTGPTEVTYHQTIDISADQMKRLKTSMEHQVANAIWNSSDDRRNWEAGITYKFKYTPSKKSKASHIAATVVYEAKRSLTITVNGKGKKNPRRKPKAKLK